MTDFAPDDTFSFTAAMSNGHEATHTVYVKGNGPPILLMQELPGIVPETLVLVDRLNAAGFRVYMPHFLGPFGKFALARNTLRLLCVRREINIFAKGKQSPFADWLRELARHIRDREEVRGVGVIGMCLTGAFALTLMADDAVLGGVASQPALPVMSKGRLHMSETDIAQARAGMAAKGPGLAMRYTGDKLVPDPLWEATKRAFGDDLDSVEFQGDDHALLTVHFHQPAFDRVEAYFRERFALTG